MLRYNNTELEPLRSMKNNNELLSVIDELEADVSSVFHFD